MNDIQIFENEEFGSIRTIEINGEPWFVGKDIAIALKYKNTTVALQDNVEEEDKVVTKVSTLGGTQNTTVINESGLYSLVFGSRTEKAREFKHWVTSDVLPAIRKHGIYVTDDVIDNILNNPDFGIKLLTQLKEERNARIKAEKTVAILTHVNKTYTMTEIAKELGFKSAVELNRVLRDRHIQYKSNGTWVFYSKYSALGYESIKQEVNDYGKVIYNRHITQRGREFLLNLFGKDGEENV